MIQWFKKLIIYYIKKVYSTVVGRLAILSIVWSMFWAIVAIITDNMEVLIPMVGILVIFPWASVGFLLLVVLIANWIRKGTFKWKE